MNDDVFLTNSTVSGNSTTGDEADGGGILFGTGALTLTNSTVSGNSTTGDAAEGGGIYATNDLFLTNSTVSGNSTGGDESSGGGIYSSNGDVTLYNSTVAGNSTLGDKSEGGGIFIIDGFSGTGTGTLMIQNSIVAGNESATSIKDLLVSDDASISSIDYSVIGDTTGSGITSSTGKDNLLNIDPLLGPLANNGGPTLTHALLPGSPAIDSGDPSFDPNSFTPPLNTDQRGGTFNRVLDGDGVSGARVDIGAFEVPNFSSIVVTTADDDGSLTLGDDDLTLREAIFLANLFPSETTIMFSSLFDTAQTIDLPSQLPTITTPLTSPVQGSRC